MLRSLLLAVLLVLSGWVRGDDEPKKKPLPTISLEAEAPLRQDGSEGEDRKGGASRGQVLGREWGARHGHFAEYEFEAKNDYPRARIALRYARDYVGYGDLRLSMDGEEQGFLRYESTGGWGDERRDFRWVSLDVIGLKAGEHVLKLEVLAPRLDQDFALPELAPSPRLDLVGGRRDRNSAGHGRNVAVYTGLPSRFFFATHELGQVFSAVDGGTVTWWPDRLFVSPEAGGGERPNLNLDRIVISEAPGLVAGEAPAPVRQRAVELREVAVTRDDVVLARIHVRNPGREKIVHRVKVSGDLTASRGWRGKPGGEKGSRKVGDFMILTDTNVFPGLLPRGLSVVVGSKTAPKLLITNSAGTYRMEHELELEPGASTTLLLGCSIHPERETAQANLVRTLAEDDPFTAVRRDWERFYSAEVPSFRSSDRGLDELYAFRWYLLRFSTVGGKLGLFRQPVVLEGRQAYQTFCCFSAPFLGFDLSWSKDSRVGHGHLASLVEAAHPDGRFPWYTAPDTNQVPIHHQSGTGLSLLPEAVWKHWLIHRDSDELRRLYPGIRRNVEWWLAERDPDGDGIYAIDHQLETGMDDLLRWPDPRLRYGAVDATSYAYRNLLAVAQTAEVLGKDEHARRYRKLAARSRRALSARLWDAQSASFRDRHPEGELAEMLTITTFYPFFAGAADASKLDVFRKHLLEPREFWTRAPVPALAKSDPGYDRRGFWRGPSWPAAASHVFEAFASAAKAHDRSLLPQAAELFRRLAKNHLRPRADFYERYDPDSGAPLSSFRDYMHSWWIDLYVRHVAGLEIAVDGGLRIDPLPLGLEHFALENVPFAGKRLDLYYDSRRGAERPGLSLLVDGEVKVRDEGFEPGSGVVEVPSS